MRLRAGGWRLQPATRHSWPANAFAVSVEGIDGAGKSTLVAELGKVLEQWLPPVTVVHELTTPLGVVIRKQLPKLPPLARAYAFAAERHWLLARLGSPRIVLWDRYVDSAWACRIAEVRAGLAPPDVLDVVSELNARLPSPHLTLRLKVPVMTALRRAAARQRTLGLELVNDERVLAHQDQAFEELVRGEPRRFEELDGRVTPGELVASALEAVIARAG